MNADTRTLLIVGAIGAATAFYWWNSNRDRTEREAVEKVRINAARRIEDEIFHQGDRNHAAARLTPTEVTHDDGADPSPQAAEAQEAAAVFHMPRVRRKDGACLVVGHGQRK